jgi:glycerophosphoryl diester phosphodiesterase
MNQTTKHYYAIDFNLEEIKLLKVFERATQKLRFPNGVSSSFQISTLEEEIQLIKGLEKSFSSIYSLDKTGDLSVNRPTPGLYVEIKRPEFHASRNKANFSEIVIDLLKKYNYTSKEDNCIIQCFNPFELRFYLS